jgi:hypothetical protein
MVVVAVVMLGLIGYGAFQLFEWRGANQAYRLMQETTLPGDEVPCARVAWAGEDAGSRCATSTKDAASVAEDFVVGLREAGVPRVTFFCLDPGSPLAACTVEARTSFQHAMILIVLTRNDGSGRVLGADMEITTRHGQ